MVPLVTLQGDGHQDHEHDRPEVFGPIRFESNTNTRPSIAITPRLGIAMQKPRLMTPGPAPVPEDVLLEMAQPVIHHRTPEAKQAIITATEGLKRIFRTSNDVMILTASGTGAMEAAAVNAVPAGQKALVLDAGRFAHRWAEVCKAYGIEAICLEFEWGQVVDPQRVANALREHPDVRCVMGTLSETSTGTGHPVAEIGRIVAETDALFAVDGISGVGAMDCRVDDWQIDMLCVGSQKALMLPPGLAFISVSAKAWAQIEAFNSPCFYFDLRKARKKMFDHDTPYTPAHTLIMGLCKALERIDAEGLDAVLERHRRMSQACQAGIKALGLELFSERPAEGLTAFYVPEGLKDTDVRKQLKERFGITIVGGQDKLKGKILRFGHMGYTDELDVVGGLSALELVLDDLGYPVEPGVAVRAAQQVLLGRTTAETLVTA